MEVCRIIKAERLDDINFSDLGIHWTTKPEKCYKHINQNDELSFWIYADIDESMIWDDHTSEDHAEYPGLESKGESGEYEVTLRPGSKITISEVYDDLLDVVASDFEATI